MFKSIAQIYLSVPNVIEVRDFYCKLLDLPFDQSYEIEGVFSMIDNGEPIVDLAAEFPSLQFDFTRAFVQKTSPSISFGRREIGKKLSQAQRLLPPNYQFLIKECYRPLSVQKGFWDNYYGFLSKKFPEWTPERLHLECSKYVAPLNVAPHSTGGAVDLTLIDADGNWLEMGSQFNAEPSECDYRTYFNSDKISSSERKNREILHDTLTACGFVNYPTEWWHWSFGDKYWAFCTQAKAAIYDSYG